MRRLSLAACTLSILILTACGGGGGGSSSAGSASASSLSAAAQVGEKLFNDTILSSTGAMSCASCHDKGNHHAAADTRSVPAGAEAGHEAGRQAPSLQYLKFNTAFAFAADGTPTGGFTWDGRAATLAEQVGPEVLAQQDRVGVVDGEEAPGEGQVLFELRLRREQPGGDDRRVEAAEGTVRLDERGRESVRLFEVAVRERDRRGSGHPGLQICGALAELFEVPPEQVQAIATRCQPARQCAADALRSTQQHNLRGHRHQPNSRRD